MKQLRTAAPHTYSAGFPHTYSAGDVRQGARRKPAKPMNTYASACVAEVGYQIICNSSAAASARTQARPGLPRSRVRHSVQYR
jgi:hypothetical protein